MLTGKGLRMACPQTWETVDEGHSSNSLDSKKGYCGFLSKAHTGLRLTLAEVVLALATAL